MYRAQRRGMKELDVVLSSFVSKHLETLTEEELVLLKDLLLEPELSLQKWLVDHQPPAEKYTSFVAKILAPL